MEVTVGERNSVADVVAAVVYMIIYMYTVRQTVFLPASACACICQHSTTDNGPIDDDDCTVGRLPDYQFGPSNWLKGCSLSVLQHWITFYHRIP